MAPILVPAAARIPLRSYVIYRDDLQKWLDRDGYVVDQLDPKVREAEFWTSSHSAPRQFTTDVTRLYRRDVRRFTVGLVEVEKCEKWWHRSLCQAVVSTTDAHAASAVTDALLDRPYPLVAPTLCRLSDLERADPQRTRREFRQRVVIGVVAALVVASIFAVLALGRRLLVG